MAATSIYVLKLGEHLDSCDCGKGHKLKPIRDVAAFGEKSAARRARDDKKLLARYQWYYPHHVVELYISELFLNPPLSFLINPPLEDSNSELEPPGDSDSESEPSPRKKSKKHQPPADDSASESEPSPRKKSKKHQPPADNSDSE